MTSEAPDDSEMVVGIDHVQLAMPPGGEDRARRFYTDVLGLRELPKPSSLAARGGCWFAGDSAHVHLGVESDFSPASKAHPALVVTDLEAVRQTLNEAGVSVVEDDSLDVRRFYAYDPFGNRLEFVDRADRGFSTRAALLDQTWPADWDERKAGRGCVMCDEGRPERVPDGERVAEGTVTDSYLVNRSDAPGYVFCVWRGRHVAEVTQLDESEAVAFWSELRQVARAVEASCRPAKLNIQILGNAIPHLHAHVVPRYDTDPAPGKPPHFLENYAPPLDVKTYHDLKARIASHVHDTPS